jgi:hypothetical protein
MQQALPLERPAVSQTNTRQQVTHCKEKPAPEQQKHKERCTHNEILQMLVESMVGYSEQALGRTKETNDIDTRRKKTGCCGASNKQRPAMATNRQLTRALA